MSKLYQQVHKKCGGSIVVGSSAKKIVLLCRKCFEQWHTSAFQSIPTPDDFQNVPTSQRELVTKAESARKKNLHNI